MRLIITLTDDQLKQLEQLMKDDLATNKSFYLSMLVAQEARRRTYPRNFEDVTKTGTSPASGNFSPDGGVILCNTTP